MIGPTYLSGGRQVVGSIAGVTGAASPEPPERSERRTQAERRAASEVALLAAAAELIAERGFERTSLRSIGERAGVSRAMPAYHFGSKGALVARLVQRGSERTVLAAAEAVQLDHPDGSSPSTLEVLRVIIDTYLDSLAVEGAPEERAVVVMWGASFPSASPLPTVVMSDRQSHRALADTIRTGQQDGSVRKDVDPDAAAWWVMGMARGLAGLSLNQPAVAADAAVRRLCGEAIAAILGPQPER
jgi:AcrR family transcriptional regulator